MKTKLALFFCILTLVLGLSGINEVFAKTIKLRMAHFVSTKHPQHKVMAEWADTIGKLTNGRVDVKIFPGGALGKPPKQYDAAAKGVVDIAFGLQSYTTGRFPLTTFMDLPFMVKSAEEGATVLWKVYEKYLRDEYKDVKVLWMLVHGPGQIFTTKKEVKTIEDLKGLKICSSGAVIGRVLTKLGAVPVTSPITEFYEAMERGVTDGVAIPFEGMPPFRFHEVCKYSTVLNLYTTPFFVVMNKKKYESLPDDIKKIIDENSGLVWSAKAGKGYDMAGQKGLGLVKKKNMTINEIRGSEFEKWKALAMPIRDGWVKEMTSKGLPGDKVMKYAMEVIAQQ